MVRYVTDSCEIRGAFSRAWYIGGVAGAALWLRMNWSCQCTTSTRNAARPLRVGSSYARLFRLASCAFGRLRSAPWRRQRRR